MKTILLLGLLALTASIAVAEPVLSSPNALGLYFDGEAASFDLTLGAPATIDVYLIFTDPTIAFINAWEAKVTISTGGAIVDTSFPGGTVLYQAGPDDWAAELTSPMPCNARTKLAVFQVAFDAEQNTFLYLGNVDNPMAPGNLPGVRLQDDSWSSVPVISGDPSLPVASLNSSTPNESTSWGSVKTLYR